MKKLNYKNTLTKMRNNWVIFETGYCSLLKTAYDIAKKSMRRLKFDLKLKLKFEN